MKKYSLIGGLYKSKLIGSWYSEDYEDVIEQYRHNNIYNTHCILVPHAGMKYSGYVAAKAYFSVNWKNIKNVIILCTLHNSDNNIYIPSFSKIQLKNQTRKINNNIINELKKYFEINNNKFYEEHSFEMQLPFIFYLANKDVKIIPLLIGNANLEKASNILKSYIDQETLVITTSDFTHYGPKYGYTKNTDNIRDFIRRKDMSDIDAIIDNDLNSFKGITVCGKYAICLMMHLAKILNWSIPELLAYKTSSDDDNIIKNSVSYISLIYKYNYQSSGYKKNILELAK